MLVVNDRDQVELRLNAKVLRQFDVQNEHFLADSKVVCNIDRRDLVRLLETALGYSATSQGAIVIWTYYDEISPEQPIVRTLLSLDGDISQKIYQPCLRYAYIDLIFKTHSYVIRQISQQLVITIANYLDSKLFPINLFFCSLIGSLTFCNAIDAIAKPWLNQFLANPVFLWFSNFPWRCWLVAIAFSLMVLCIWKLSSHLLENKSDRPQSTLANLSKLTANFAINKIFIPLGQILDQGWVQKLAWVAIAMLGICWLILLSDQYLKFISIDPRLLTLISNIEHILETTFSFSLYSVRQKIWQIISQFLFSSKAVSALFKFVTNRFAI
jgi:hypothetical protein